MTTTNSATTESRSRFANLWRYYITGTLIAESPVHIGSLAGATIDMPISLDGAGTPIIPGTALAGVLRNDTDAWGTRDRQARLTSTSRITVHDAKLREPLSAVGQVVLEIRDGVSINRYTGAAQPGFLYDMEVLPSNSAFDFHCTVEAPGPRDVDPPSASASNSATEQLYPWDNLPATVKDLLDSALRGFAVGRKTSSGLGRLRLTNPVVRCRNLAESDHLIALLAERGALTEALPNSEVPAIPRSEPVATAIGSGLLRVEVPWQAKGPVLVADNPLGDAVDTVPLVTRDGDRVRLVIPGSSIKGALRSQAERILRTVLGERSFGNPAIASEDLRQNHLRDLAATDGMALIAALFGTAGDSSQPGIHSGSRGALTISECRTTTSWNRTNWLQVRSANKAEPKDGRSQDMLLKALTRLEESAKPQHQPRCAVGRFLIGDHVAIDRWTGGAADGALFSVLEPWLTAADDWEPLVIDIDWSRLAAFRAGSGDGDDNLALAAYALLLLTIQDFCDGWIPLGYGAAKGYGSVKADAANVEVRLPESTGRTVKLTDVLGSTDSEVRRELTTAWQSWIDQRSPASEGAGR